jgi:two-component system, OmpR family, sensor histidine kinase KdpD
VKAPPSIDVRLGTAAVRVYYFSPETGLYQGEAFLDQGDLGKLEGVTSIAPPSYGRGEVPLFDADTQIWKLRKLQQASVTSGEMKRAIALAKPAASCYPVRNSERSKQGPHVSLLAAIRGYLIGILLVAAATVACEFIRPHLIPTNMVMVYQLAVVVAAVKLGLRPAIAAAFLSVLAFDFFFVPPRLTFSVAEKEYLVTFLGFFVVGVIISSLVAKVREQSLERERLSQEAEKARILQAQENLERALLNSISHDLRTPLVSIKGALSALKDKGDLLSRQAQQELLETASDEAERLNRFVGNLLDMTRLEAGALHPRIEPSDVQELVGCALSAVEGRLGKRNVSVSLPPGLTLVPLDMVLMTQVLVNLLDNANKYAPADSGIEIEATVADPWLVLTVADRGPGTPEQELSHIFDKFHHVRVPETAGGTGLGLSICKGIVEAHGGKIRASNREGGGLVIEVLLPVTRSEEL